MDNIIGVYICSGCEIGDSVDLEKVENVATKEYKVKVCKKDQCLCSDKGVETIKSDIQSEELNKLVVAACSSRVMTDVFKFDNVILERVNLREHVAWCHEPNDEDTDMLAEDMMRMGIVKVEKTSPLTPHIEEDQTKDILVVGGGAAGLQAAITASNLGYNVTIVEKEKELGGWGKKELRQVPDTAPYTAPVSPVVLKLISQADAADNIALQLDTTIEKISGQPGKFQVVLANGKEFKVGSIVQATGAKPYDPANLGHLGYGKSENIVTHANIEQMAIDGKFLRPSDGQPAKKVVFIQCAGSRDENHLPYCSANCCAESLKQAYYLRKTMPDSEVYIVYKDMRTPGQHELFYKAMQDDPGVFLTKGDVTGVNTDDENLSVEVENTLFGESISIEADLVVLANGMVPNSEALQLQYRLGTDLPDAKYGFPDSEFICFPYETRRTGIYAAGTVRQPMDVGLALDDGTGAAFKAIQAMELYGRGAVVHPRALDISWPEFFLQRCTQCKRCTEECPFGALDEDEKGTPLINPNRCRRCGICMGACPERIVNFQNYSIDMVVNMIKANEVPEEDEEKPRVIAFVCENDAYPTFDLVGLNKIKYSSYLRIIPVRCLGSINTVWVTTALDSGFDGILYIGCKHGDDYQCHMVKGSELATTRMENVSEKLEKMMLEPERVQVYELALTDYDKLPELIDKFMETIEEVGPNPFKDM